MPSLIGLVPIPTRIRRTWPQLNLTPVILIGMCAKSMRIGPALLSLCILISATGCAIIPQRYRLAAEPLMPVPSPNPPASLSGLQQVSLLVQDSQTKCSSFVDSMFAEAAASGFILDILSTGTSALATVFTPLAAVHSLTASSTIFGAAKTGISANYLNTLSISHISQAIQSTYTTDIRKYIASLDSLDVNQKSTIDPYVERSKIISYHNECSLAAAEGSISAALQPAGQPTGQGLQVIHQVVASENTPELLAAAIASDINGTFGKVGITATASGKVISLRMTNPVTLTVTSSPPGLAQYVAGPPGLLTITGTPHKGDNIIIAGPLATQQPSGAGTQPSGGGTQPSGSAQTAPAAISGENPALK